MTLKNLKKMVAIGLSLVIVANLTQPIYASDLGALSQNSTTVNSQPNSTDFSKKSVEERDATTAKRKALASAGYCGSTVAWRCNAAYKVLTIWGSGNMSNWSSGASVYDWGGYRKNVTVVHIEPGVATVGDYAFNNCNALRSVPLPETLERIGTDAFSSCSRLGSGLLPSGLGGVDLGAFVR